MALKQADGQTEGDFNAGSAHPEDELEATRKELRNAIRAQDQLREQLEATLAELSQFLSRQRRAESGGIQDGDLQRIESRVRGVEQRLNRTTEQVQVILQSRIWRTLVRAGGMLLRIGRLGR